MATNITTRAKDYSQWYLDVIAAGDMADHSPVRGCMVIKPHGYGIWELIRDQLDARFKATGHVNAYFPLFIPMSFLAKEAKHVEGFAMECAVVTHSGLEQDGKGGLRPKGQIEEPLIVRPTSETIIGHTYAQWIQSWRDLPLLINQWANVVRWEMRTRLFLRTMEFLWQEGHTAHETADEAQTETLQMLDVYTEFAENVLAIPVVRGEKSAAERFAGAERTYCIEAMMQDGKALQSGTSHNLGQNFSKAFDIKYQTRDQKVEHVWTTSWGVSTRLIGGVIMTHADDEGLVLPPAIAPIVVAIVPIYRKDEEREAVLAYAKGLMAQLVGGAVAARAVGGSEIMSSVLPGSGRRVVLDLRDGLRPPDKFFHWEQRGVPVRIEVGPRDLQNGKAVVVTRVNREKSIVDAPKLTRAWLDATLATQQQALLDRARAFRIARTFAVDTYEDFRARLDGGGFFLMHWDGTAATETRIKEETKATIRCIPSDNILDSAAGPVDMRATGTDPVSGQASKGRVIFARAY
ncbi:MAG: proline--tRNA ligase [Planctomycetes bacterium]|nr:proline--tRNA ligase [Planctomycetota bacterium]